MKTEDVCARGWCVYACVCAHRGLHPLLIHLISGNRPQARGISLVFDLLLFLSSPSLVSPLLSRKNSFFSAHININRALNAGIPATNCPLWSSCCQSLPIPPRNDTGEIDGPHTELALTEGWFIPFMWPHPHLFLPFTAPFPPCPSFLLSYFSCT